MGCPSRLYARPSADKLPRHIESRGRDMRAFAKRHSLSLYFVLAFVWFWGCIALGYIQSFHFWAPLLGAFAPALSALVVTGMAGGEPEVRELGCSLRKWRVGWLWYIVAF